MNYTPYIARLRELAAGAKPENYACGICSDLHRTVSGSRRVDVYSVMEDIFTNMGLECYFPMGDQRRPWEGAHGILRRALAGAVADYLEHGTIDAEVVNACRLAALEAKERSR